MYFVYAVMVTVSMAIVLINFQPYKLSVAHYTTIDVSFLLLLPLFYVTIVGKDAAVAIGEKGIPYTFNCLVAVTGTIPMVYVTVIVLHWIYSKQRYGRMLLTRISNMMNCHSSSE